ncbi:MAG: 4-carboxy muconolactone decarboxylase [Acidobacteria bacterium]|nr:MAG: 4-carboxy muconolactone decarboxylase [Acidobacteriota bacterium]
MRLVTFALEACILLLVIGAAAAQDRMPPIPKEKMTEAQKKAFDEVTSGPRGAGGAEGPFVPLLRSPEFMSVLQKTGEYVRFHNSIGPKLTEFVILLTARQWTQQYEYNAHQPLALKAGVKQETISAITEGRRPTGMAADEEIVYDFCTELRQNQSVSDATYARAVSKFGEQGVIDMTGLVGYYTTLAMIMNVARSPLADGKKAPLAPFPH